MAKCRQVYATVLNEVDKVRSFALVKDLLLVFKIRGRPASVDQYQKAVSINLIRQK